MGGGGRGKGVGMSRRMGAGVWLWGVEGGKSVGRSRRRGAGVGVGTGIDPILRTKNLWACNAVRSRVNYYFNLQAELPRLLHGTGQRTLFWFLVFSSSVLPGQHLH